MKIPVQNTSFKMGKTTIHNKTHHDANAEKIRLAMVNVEQNRGVIFHNMRSLSFVDGLLMGLQYGFEISAFGETDLDVEELSK